MATQEGNVKVRIAVLTLAVAGLGAAVYASLLWADIDVATIDVPWLAVAALVVVTESSVINVEYRKEAHSFSLGEFPLVLGLFALSPTGFITAGLVGMLVALAIIRRQRPIKLAYNLVQQAVSLGVAFWVFVALGAGAPLDPTAWLAALGAAIAAQVVNVAAIATVIAISEGRTPFDRFSEVVAVAFISTAASATLGLIAAMLVSVEPISLPLFVIPIAIIYIAFRAYVAERDKHESLELLYDSARIIQSSAEVEAAARALLEQCRQAFRAQLGEISLFPESETDPVVQITVSEDDVQTRLRDDAELAPHHAHLTSAQWLRALAEQLEEPVHVTATAPHLGGLPGYLAAHGIREALIAPLHGETRTIGVMLLADRLVEVSSFGASDLRLFAALANQVSSSLEVGRLERTLHHITELQDQLRHQAHHDSLTGLANRARFREFLDDAVERSRRTRESLALLYVDLDDFKSINDTRGHEAGDRLLQIVARRLSGAVRPNDLVARLGGDEFAVVLCEADEEELEQLAERIAETLNAPAVIDGDRLEVRASVGVSVHDHRIGAREFIRQGDVSMYHAKQHGLGTYVRFAPRMQEEADRRLRLRQDLRRAVRLDQFVAQFQPFVDLGTRRVAGFESLVRWQHPVQGLMTPRDFLAIARDSDLVLELDRLMLRRVTGHAARWIEETGRDDLVVSVNLSARHLADDDMNGLIAETCARAGLPHRNLMIEVTEQDVINDVTVSVDVLARLKDLGVRVAIDDFGTGYSALAYLRDFPVDVLKIAQPFVQDVLRGDQRILARAIVDLASGLGLTTIAEGIERPEQARLLAEWGANLGQGYLYSKPVPPEAALQLLRESPDADAMAPVVDLFSGRAG